VGNNIAEETLNMYYTMIMNNLESLQGDSLEQFKNDLTSFKQALTKEVSQKMDKDDLDAIEKTFQDLNM
jgi:prephenate dehydrogenase